MTRRRLLRRSDDRGAAAVEFGLVIIPLALILFGIIDFGRAYNAQETLTQAARVGARLAVVGTSTADVQDAVEKAAKPTVDLTDADVVVTGDCSAGATSVQVKVSYTFTFWALWIVNPTTDMDGVATAPC